MNATPKIGIWGPTGSGKTAYLAALYLELQKEWTIIYESSIGRDSSHLQTTLANTLSLGEFPPATARENKHYAFFFTPNRENFLRDFFRTDFSLSLIEAPGDFTGRDPSPEGEDEISRYYEHLRECNGLIITIDAEARNKLPEDMFGDSKGTYFMALQKLFNLLESDRNGKIVPNLAFCLTKIDNDYTQKRIAEIGLERSIYEVIGEDAKNLINARCQTKGIKQKRRYFGISVVGTYMIEEHKRPNIHFSPRENKFQIAKPSERKPIDITLPLEWLLSKSLVK